MPEGFRITDVKRDGENVNWSRTYVDTSAEGRYLITYECPKTSVSYTLDVTVDTTPPELVLLGVDESGRARGPVSIEGKGERDTLTVTKNGEPMSMLLSYTLTQSGRYVATITDEAGNSNAYSFAIMVYLDKNSRIFVVMFLAAVAAVAGIFFYHRKHLRVR